MIQAMIFDLDGTLVRIERLKALSYARAAIELCPNTIREEEVIEAYKDVVGLSRREVVMTLMERFKLEVEARTRMAEFGVSAPWQADLQIRLRIYEEMLSDPEVLRSNQWSYNVALLHEARQSGCITALATMSRCDQTRRVLKILNLDDSFDFIATVDDVENGKPDPEIYKLVARELATNSTDCLVIEDSPSGVKAAVAAKMWCIAVTTPFTRERIHAERLIDDKWIVDDPAKVTSIVKQMIEERKKDRRQSRSRN